MDIGGSGGNHVGSVDRVKGNLVAHHLKVEQSVRPLSHYVEVGYRALRAAQLRHDAVLVHLHAADSQTVHGDYTVASLHTYFLARAFAYHLQHHERILHHVEAHADALKVSAERLIEFLSVLSVSVCGVRIELAKHTVDGIFHKFFLVYAVHVEAGHGKFRHLQFSHLCKVHVAKA